MPRTSSQNRSQWGSQRSRSAEGKGKSLQLLRNTHIFASAVHDILEMRILHDVSAPAPALTLPQFHLLKLMSLDGHRQVGDVAGFLGVSAPAATKTIDKLERLGLITRQHSKEDRRAILLSPSPKGRRLVSRYVTAMNRRLAPIFKEFSRSEVAKLAEMLERFALCLIRQADSEDDLCLRCAAYYDEDCAVAKVRGGCPYQEMLNHPHLEN